MTIQILDCTLRDGGYYNNWDFDDELVENYLQAISNTGIQIVELGLRSFPQTGFLGPYAYTSDLFLEHITIPEQLTVAVMLNAKTVIQTPGSIEEAIQTLFNKAHKSKVDMVRVATHVSDIEHCERITKELQRLGYKVALNLMQVAQSSMDKIEAIAALTQTWNTVDVLYFADSLGNMSEQSIADTIDAIKAEWNGALGIHAHNNMGKANSNSLAAIQMGVSWIDVTITGMGRGAGNAQSEILLSDLSRSGINVFDGEPLYQVVLDYFEPMQKKLGWGMNFAYHYSAIHNIHPSYAQELLSDPRYDSKDVVNSLAFLAKNNSTSFDSDLVSQGLVVNEQHEINGEWNASGWCENEDILILGSGPSLAKYAKAIESFITSNKIKALSLNLHKEISDASIYAYVAADAKRLVLDIKRYQHIKKPMFLPRRFIPESITSELSLLDIRDYDLSVISDQFTPMNTGCELPYQLSIAYAISLCLAGGAKRIFLAGFDGYGAEDKRQIEMIKVFEIIKKNIKPEQIISLTPTNYPVIQGSIYAPY